MKIPLRYAYYGNPLAATSLRNNQRQIIERPDRHSLLPSFATEYAMLQCNDYVEQLETQQHVLQRSHEVEADRPTRGNCDAFADDRHDSGDSLAHPVAKEPPRSRPTCHRYSHVWYPLP